MLEALEAPLSVCTMLVPERPVANIGLPNVAWQGTLGLTEASVFRTGSWNSIFQFKGAPPVLSRRSFLETFSVPSSLAPGCDYLRDSTVTLNAPIQDVTLSSFLSKAPFADSLSLTKIGLVIPVCIRLISKVTHSWGTSNSSYLNNTILGSTAV